MALILVASGCASVIGLGDYEIRDEPAPTLDVVDGGGVTNPVDAAFTADRALETPADAADSPDSTTTTGPICSRTSCPPGSWGKCAEEACNQNATWTQTGGSTALDRNGICTVSKNKVYVDSPSLPASSAFSFELGFTFGILDDTTATVVEITSQSTVIATVMTDEAKIKLCAGDSITKCTNERDVPASTSHKTIDIDVYGVVAANGAMKLYFSVGTNQCPGADRLDVANAEIHTALSARVGCIGYNDECKLSLDNLTFSVTPE